MSKEIESQIARLALVVSTRRRDPDLDKLREEIKEIRKQLPKSVSVKDLKRWIPRVLESLSVTNPEEEDRKEGREGKEWRHPPVNYAPLPSNMQDRNIDVGSVLYDEIEIHGRQTPDELLKHVGGIDGEMVTMVYLSMLADNYLKWYKEKDKISTLELVELTDDEKEANKRRNLVDKRDGKTKKRKGRKKSTLDRIKVVEFSRQTGGGLQKRDGRERGEKKGKSKSKSKSKIKFVDNTEDEEVIQYSPNQRRIHS